MPAFKICGTNISNKLYFDYWVGELSIQKKILGGSFVVRSNRMFFSIVVMNQTHKRIDFKMKTIDVDGKTVKLQIWDTAGQDRFRAITTTYYRGAMGIVLMYDITSEPSFSNVRNWVETIHEHASDNVSIALVGNKCDMIDQRVLERRKKFTYFGLIVVSKENGKKIADEYGIRFYETSAKDDINVKEMFVNLARDILIKNQIKEEINKQSKEKTNIIKAIPAKLELATSKKKCTCT
ncbi:hypothetical protein RFI_00195 [Reticulomyxa filosa]|uniref:Uncharacterized protein n=1 Tax=Reticulomyxa filosa TaxID=46433 RepID=X6PFM0_RETFI|nr:hypothetical protein RFI_00195 [Reticulomyxa filosa]|eukprot:ETO36868.1 hypothetical protein RFI_00195 [Reticulomyxa filosa]